MNLKNNMNLSAPWMTYCRKLQELFNADPEIEVSDITRNKAEFRNYDYCITIQVKNHDKARALQQVLRKDRDFGNVSLRIFIYEDEQEMDSLSKVMHTLFDWNDHVSRVIEGLDPTGCEQIFVMFEPEVIQFFNDNMRDFNGYWSGLAEDIARDVIDCEGKVNFCTERQTLL